MVDGAGRAAHGDQGGLDTGPVPTAARLRALNLTAVFAAIRADRPVSRAQLSRSLGLAKPTVARALDDLLAAGLVRAAEPAAEVKSFGAVFFEPVPRAAVVLVLDAGGRNLRAELVDLDGNRLARAERPLVTSIGSAGPPDPVAAAVEIRAELLHSARIPAARLTRAVLAVSKVDEPAVARLRESLGVPVRADHPVHLAALGEQRRGAGAGVADFVLLSVGQEVRAGIVLGGRPYRGGHGAAGVLDHVPGGRGFSTDSPAADAFLAFAEQRVRLAGSATTLRSPVRVPRVLAAARSGDRLASELVAAEARRIARYVARLAGVLDPRMIALGGGIGANGDLLLEPVRRALPGLVPYPPTVVGSQLGDRAALVGAAVLGTEAAMRDLLAAAGQAAATPSE